MNERGADAGTRWNSAFEGAHSQLGTFPLFGDLMNSGLAAIRDIDGSRAERLRETAAPVPRTGVAGDGREIPTGVSKG